MTGGARPASATQIDVPATPVATVVPGGNLASPSSVTPVGDGQVEVQFSDATYLAVHDASTGTVSITRTDVPGSTTIVDASAAALASDSAAAQISTRASISGVSCTMLMWFLGLVASSGWEVAVAAALAMGAVGAAVVAAVMSVGTSGAIAWASSRC